MAVSEIIPTLGNATQSLLPTSFQPIVEVLTRIRGVIEILVGGIFGIYLILIILRWLEYKKVVKLLNHINKEIHELNQNLTGKKLKKKKR
ncbi:hypothetical protein KY342_05120 [Candidatus Woesearchaeota archaeon]|nr:hypothetical protein [Candidatus Woesearchaeota archaeon]